MTIKSHKMHVIKIIIQCIKNKHVHIIDHKIIKYRTHKLIS